MERLNPTTDPHRLCFTVGDPGETVWVRRYISGDLQGRDPTIITRSSSNLSRPVRLIPITPQSEPHYLLSSNLSYYPNSRKNHSNTDVSLFDSFDLTKSFPFTFFRVKDPNLIISVHPITLYTRKISGILIYSKSYT